MVSRLCAADAVLRMRGRKECDAHDDLQHGLRLGTGPFNLEHRSRDARQERCEDGKIHKPTRLILLCSSNRLNIYICREQ